MTAVEQELAALQEANSVAIEAIQVGDVIHDGIAIARVTGEVKVGKEPAWKVTCIFPFAGQESVVLKRMVRAVMPPLTEATP